MTSVSGLPDWNYETPSSGDGANGFPDKPVAAPAVEPVADKPAPTAAASVPAKVEPGAIERPDWTGEEGEPTNEEVQLPTENAGTAIGLGPDLVATWEHEGGYQQNLKRAQDAVTKILSVEGVGDLEQRFDGLPNSIQNKVFDCLRLSPSHGPDAALMRLDQIEKSLTPDEMAVAERWLKSLTPEQSRALLYGLGNK